MSLDERVAYDGGHMRNSVKRILRVLESYGQKITFFTVAEINEAYPELLELIACSGHEIGLHTYRHESPTTLQEMEADLALCEPFRKQFGVISFRAPGIKMQEQFYGALSKNGYRYDSSIYGTTPISRSGVTVYPVSLLPYLRDPADRVPRSLGNALLRDGVPFGSGLFLGMPRHIIDALIGLFARKYHTPPCLFLHSWQVVQPTYPLLSKLRNPWMLAYSIEMQDVFERLANDYKFLLFREAFQ